MSSLANLTFACWLIVGAMICDMLDGRVARMTRRTSDFGGQLDSLCDAISFGAAPAVLASRAGVLLLYSQQVVPMSDAGQLGVIIGRLMWCISAIYLACAVLRLARFNAENEPDESSHLAFEGLPSPGAAGAVIAAILLLAHLAKRGWGVDTWLSPTFTIALPTLTLLTALLMVSRVGYPHLVNQLIRSHRPFGTLVKLTILAVLLLIEPLIFASAGAIGYVLAGVVREGYLRIRGRSGQPAENA
jgi:CDP-diacylglycerol--serine O-phosphatidyltransferase